MILNCDFRPIGYRPHSPIGYIRIIEIIILWISLNFRFRPKSVVEAASGQCQKQSLGAGTGLRLAAPFQQFIEADGTRLPKLLFCRCLD